ncbi:hypothetical protein BOTBODRAFT_154659 [Botryobasidium botryosum FD-172 SS1]|uniref:Endonuclease III homolog n=1 Tax=Botryobasidium botryosum (strain FD-172 SS1) TaxID=930990 RepID=A0A067N3H7_BOTB1|nr:hypothetical protein BOTBODRAFT_154659 [Botryobasidium botryosum FD-172 SS1]
MDQLATPSSLGPTRVKLESDEGEHLGDRDSSPLTSLDGSSNEGPRSKPVVLRRSTRSATKRAKEEVVSDDGQGSSHKLARTLSAFAYSPPKSSKAGASALTAIPASSSKIKAEPKATKSGKVKKIKAIKKALDVPHEAPANWEETYNLIKEMRKHIIAPVDTMGCAELGGDETDPAAQRYGVLVSLMLSAQTKDEVTATAVANLRTALGRLTIENVLSADMSTIEQAVCKVGFWRRKAQYIKQAAQKLKDEFDSELPKTVDELCSLPGVGPKMAFLALQVAWNLNEGIGVDVHVHRITNRLGWHSVPTVTPEQTRLNLQSWLPSELHAEINPLFVGFGQMICLPVGPRCDNCLLSSKGLCPSARVVNPRKGKRKSDSAKVGEGGPELKIEIEEEKAMKSAGD